MSVRHLLTQPGLIRRRLMIPSLAPRLLPAANSILSRSYAVMTDKLPRDDEIRRIPGITGDIEFIDASGTFKGLSSLNYVLANYDREKYHLVCINPHKVPEPVMCKLVSKEQLEEEERIAYYTKKLKKRTNKDPTKTVKKVEISWATAPNDFDHKMKKINDFLLKGNRVDVVLGVRKGMAKQPLGKMVELVENIKKLSADFGKVWKASEGSIGIQYTIYFEGNKPKKTAEELRILEEIEAIQRGIIPERRNSLEGGDAVEKPKVGGETIAAKEELRPTETKPKEEVSVLGREI